MLKVGDPATIHLYTDSLPAVVTRINRKSIAVCRVAVIPDTRIRLNDAAEPFPVYLEQGDLDEIIGEPERYKIIESGDGSVHYRNGSISVTVGRSVKITDYRH